MVISIRRPVFIILLALLLHLSSAAAFTTPLHFTLESHRHQTLLLIRAQNKNKEVNDDVESKRTYTKIDDGSPIGVAIVGIGGLLYSKGGDYFSFDFLQDSSNNNAVWIILATASTAAGLSRLVRYLNDKESNNNQ